MEAEIGMRVAGHLRTNFAEASLVKEGFGG
jgi:hypothetical protein